MSRAEDWAADVERHPDRHCAAVRAAVARQRRDLAGLAGWRFEEKRGERVIRFVERLPRVKGRAGRLVLEGWQCWWLSTLFGWVDHNGLRRFQECHLWVPKKNGKSTIAAAIALYCLCADGEGAPEIYVAAAKMEQARIVADVAHAMARGSPALRSTFALALTGGSSARPPHLRCGRNGGTLRPLARDHAGSQDGLDVHAAIVDEIHAHRTPDMYQILAQGTAGRAQPLTLITSTAGFDLEGIGKKRYDALVDVLRGRDDNDGLFGCIWEADDSDDWRAESTWRKANPNLGVSVNIRSLEQQRTNDEHVFRVKRLNQWASSHRQWMDMSAWRLAARPDLAPPAGAPIWVGVHVSAGAEPSAGCALWFEDDDWRAVFRVWVPSAAAGRYEEEMERSGVHRIQLDDIADWVLSWGDAVRAVCLDPRASGPLATVWGRPDLPSQRLLADAAVAGLGRQRRLPAQRLGRRRPYAPGYGRGRPRRRVEQLPRPRRSSRAHRCGDRAAPVRRRGNRVARARARARARPVHRPV